MKKMILADYIGHSDALGKPMGHPIKVINETYALIKPIFRVHIAVPESHMPSIIEDEATTIELKYNVCAFSKQKVLNFVKKWVNLSRIFHNRGDSTVWFINVDFSLFLYLYLRKIDKVWINLCYNPLKNVSGWRNKVIHSVLKNVEKVILTNQNFVKKIPGSTVFIPDYYYNEKLYDRFQGEKKLEQMVCLGTMGKEKKLEDLVLIMKKSSIPLVVCGNFKHSEERYQNLQKLSEGHICLENKFVSDDEYYDFIAKSQYVVLPYDMTLYDERTSGILIEAVFLHSVPVAPQQLLEYNGISGIGYQEVNEIPGLLGDVRRNARIIENNDKLIGSVFSAESMRKRLSIKGN